MREKKYKNKLKIVRKVSYAVLEKRCGKINIEIDILTSCLKRIRDGKVVNTYFVEGLPLKKELDNWEFDWCEEAQKGYRIMQLYAEGDSRLQGLVSTKIRKDIHAIEINLVEASPINNPHNKMFVRKEYEGIGGHLFAEAIRQSYDAGFDGFVMFVAKTDLINYYEEKIGAYLINNKTRVMCIDERSAKRPYEQYFKK